MPDRCVVYGCYNEASLEKGISVFRIPFENCDSVEGRARWKAWIDFIKTKRKNFIVSRNSSVCSNHFTPDSFQRRYAVPGQARILRKDGIGVVAIPTIFEKKQETSEISARSRRMVVRELLSQPSTSNCQVPSEERFCKEQQSQGLSHSPESHPPLVESDIGEKEVEFEEIVESCPKLKETAIQKEDCQECTTLEKRNRHLKQLWLGAKHKLELLQKSLDEVADTVSGNHPPRAKPKCSVCKRHMKGHSKLTDCPKNK